MNETLKCTITGTLPENIKSVFAYVTDNLYNSCSDHERNGTSVILNEAVTLRSDADKNGIIKPEKCTSMWQANTDLVVKLENLRPELINLGLKENQEIYGICIQPNEAAEDTIVFACCPKECGALPENDPQIFWKFPKETVKIQLLND